MELADEADAVSEGDLAREALWLLANDLEHREPLTALIQSPPTEKFLEMETVAIRVGEKTGTGPVIDKTGTLESR